MSFLQPIPKDHYVQYGDVSAAEVLPIDYEAKILESYKEVLKFVIKQPFKRTDPIFLNPKPLSEHFSEARDKLRVILANLESEKTKVDKELGNVQLTLDKKEMATDGVTELFWALAPTHYSDLIRNSNFLYMLFWEIKIQKLSLTLAEIHDTIECVKKMSTLATLLIESPANVVFRLKNLEVFSLKTELCETVQMKRRFNRISTALGSSKALLEFFGKLSQQSNYEQLADPKYLEKYIDPSTCFSQSCSIISVELEDMLSSMLRKSNFTYAEIVKHRTMSELETFAESILNKLLVNSNVIRFYLLPLQRLLYGMMDNYTAVEEDNGHAKMVNNAHSWLQKDTETKALLEPMSPAIESCIKWIDELTFTFFPYDSAFFVNEAISSLEQMTQSFDSNRKVKLVCAAISFSYLPDPMFIMKQLIEVVTRPACPPTMRKNCSMFVSACQMFSNVPYFM